MPDGPARAAAFFGGAWVGVGEVSDLFGRRLRRLNMSFDSEWSAGDAAYLFNEHSAAEDGSSSLHRCWHVQTDGEGAYVGVESLQGGRLVAEDRPWGFTLRFDRPKVVRGPNVTNLDLRVRRVADDLDAKGWSRVAGLPLVRTRIRLRPAEAQGAAPTSSWPL